MCFIIPSVSTPASCLSGQAFNVNDLDPGNAVRWWQFGIFAPGISSAGMIPNQQSCQGYSCHAGHLFRAELHRYFSYGAFVRRYKSILPPVVSHSPLPPLMDAQQTDYGLQEVAICQRRPCVAPEFSVLCYQPATARAPGAKTAILVFKAVRSSCSSRLKSLACDVFNEHGSLLESHRQLAHTSQPPR